MSKNKGLQWLLFGIGFLYLKNQISKKSVPEIFYCKSLPFGFNACTVPPFGVFILESEKNNMYLLEHELIHWKQYQELGLINYCIRYQNEIKHFGYDKAPMEIEARFFENQYVKDNYTFAVRSGIAKTVFNPEFRK